MNLSKYVNLYTFQYYLGLIYNIEIRNIKHLSKIYIKNIVIYVITLNTELLINDSKNMEVDYNISNYI